jgi:hypothetical protein
VLGHAGIGSKRAPHRLSQRGDQLFFFFFFLFGPLAEGEKSLPDLIPAHTAGFRTPSVAGHSAISLHTVREETMENPLDLTFSKVLWELHKVGTSYPGLRAHPLKNPFIEHQLADWQYTPCPTPQGHRPEDKNCLKMSHSNPA